MVSTCNNCNISGEIGFFPVSVWQVGVNNTMTARAVWYLCLDSWWSLCSFNHHCLLTISANICKVKKANRFLVLSWKYNNDIVDSPHFENFPYRSPLFFGFLYSSTNSHLLAFEDILNSLFGLDYSILYFQSLLQWHPIAFWESKYVWHIKT